MAETNVAGQIRDLRIAVVQEVNLLKNDITALRTKLGQLITDFTDLRTKYEAHVHSGITAGAADSAVRTAAGAAAAATCVGAPAALTVNGLTHTQ